MKKTLLLFIAITSFGLSSCLDLVNCLDGNGHLVAESRSTSNITGVISEGSLKVEITQGDYNEVVVEAESNLQKYIRVKHSGSNIVIDTKNRCLDNKLPIVVKVTAVDINRVELHGSGLMTCHNINTDDLNVYLSGSGMIDLGIETLSLDAKISGSGQVLIDGNTKNTDFIISGSGKIRADNLLQVNCDARISGSGKMYVNVENSLDAYISGSGSIYYYGNPDVTQSISGSGSVVKI